MAVEIFELDSIRQLKSDLKRAKQSMTPREARYLVDMYYSVQEHRKRLENQVRAAKDAGEPHSTLAWAMYQFQAAETGLKGVLDAYSDSEPMGRWAKSVCGIGPVIAAGLLAHVNIEHCTTAGKLWAFAGLDPTRKWEKGQKRPWNARLKRLCWIIGDCFVKTSNRPNGYYGRLYRERKEYEMAKNEAGDYADQARRILEEKRIGKDTEAYRYYSQGKLPPAHIDMRARRWAVKLFLSHYWEEAYRQHFGCEPPLPYPIAILGHADKIAPPV